MPFRLIILFFVLLSFQATGQESFHRSYPPKDSKEQLFHTSSIQLKNGIYASINYNFTYPDTFPSGRNNIFFNTFKPKGDALPGASYSLDQLTSIISGNLVQGDNDSLFFSFIHSDNIASIASMNVGGRIDKVMSFEKVQNPNESNLTSIIANFNKSLFSGSVSDGDDNNNIILSRKNYGLNTIWAKSYTIDDSLIPQKRHSLKSLKVFEDSTLIITGSIDSTYSYLSVIDTFGNVIWSKKYSDLNNQRKYPQSKDVAMFTDSSFVFGGISKEMNISSTVDFKGFVTKTNKKGDIDWSKRIVFSDDIQTAIYKVIIDADGDIMLAGSNQDGTASYPFAIKLKKDGSLVWKKKFPRVNVVDNEIGGLFKAQNGGIAMMHTASENMKNILSFIKLDSEGTIDLGDSIPMCEENIAEEILFSHDYGVDTLMWIETDQLIKDSIVILNTNTHEFNSPVLRLDAPRFCPNEPIVHTFDAKTDGAVTYMWASGETTDTLRVFEEGEYSVMVTVNKDVCFILCDTAKIERFTLPKVAIINDLGNYCTNGKLRLSAALESGYGKTPIKSIAWSTLESGAGSIEIATPGTYSVTIVDACDEQASAEISISEFPKKITAANITGDLLSDCIRGQATGILFASGNSAGLGPNKYIWSNGATTKDISINSTSILNYMVTVTDLCNTSAVATFDIILKGEGIKSVDIIKNISKLCTTKKIILNAITNPEGEDLKYSWASGENTASIETDKTGSYTVTVTDKCGNTASKAETLNISDFDIKNLISNIKLYRINKADCSGIEVGFTFDPDDNYDLIKSISWSTGETSSTIDYSGKKDYSVKIVDICDTEYGASQNLEPSDLRFANVFFPDGFGLVLGPNGVQDTVAFEALQSNRTFGPVRLPQNCLSEIDDYEFYVFNRWGQTVFESNDFRNEWDGMISGQKAATDTYIWVVKYKIFGTEKKQKGDVSLIRQ